MSYVNGVTPYNWRKFRNTRERKEEIMDLPLQLLQQLEVKYSRSMRKCSRFSAFTN
jgi:hypothetical protein